MAPASVDAPGSPEPSTSVAPVEFGLTLVCAMIFGTLVYWPLRELHHGWALEGAAGLIACFDPSLGLVLVDGAGTILEQPRPAERSISVTRGTLDLTQVGVVLLPALWLAGPRGRRAPGRGLAALVLLLVLQTAGLACAAWSSIHDSQGASLARDLASHVGLVLPVFLWFALLDPSQETSASKGACDSALPEVGRNAPCPCGSGSKFKHCCAELGRSLR